MRHTILKCSALAYYAIFAAAIVLSGIYLTSAVKMFSAFAAHRESETLSKLTENPADSPKLRQLLDAALARHPAHGKYHAARASLLAESPENGTAQIEADLQEAIRRDPANADYYYEAGRITAARQLCAPSAALSPDNAGESCVTARYFSAALRNAPNDLFFRAQIASWLDYYHHELAARTMRRLLARDSALFLGHSGQYAPEFGHVFYQLRLDAESEAVFALAGAQSPPCQPIPISTDAPELEVARDDGVADWMAKLQTSADRVKNVLCLPHQLAQFQAASLRILMNLRHAPHDACALLLTLDDRTQTIPCAELGITPQWHEFAIDLAQLSGKTSVTMFLRVSGMEQTGNALEIWGDQQAATRFSEFGFRQQTDLSQTAGKQTGEYMIRLRLTRQNDS